MEKANVSKKCCIYKLKNGENVTAIFLLRIYVAGLWHIPGEVWSVLKMIEIINGECIEKLRKLDSSTGLI